VKTINPDIFKSYDIRGEVGKELDADIAERVGRTLADWLPNTGAVAVGRDMRSDSTELAAAVIKGLRKQGRNVIDVGLITTDMIYYAVGNDKLAGGAMVTASHNPGIYNGIKLCRDEARPLGLDNGLDQIRDAVIANKFNAASSIGNLTNKDIDDGWIQHVLSFINVKELKPLHLAVDAGNGMAGKIFPTIEKYLPYKIEEMYFKLDGTFPNHLANPLIPGTLHDMCAKIKTEKLDGGIAFDGDGDRAFLVDETGTILTGGAMSAIIAAYFLEKFPGANIVYDIRNSRIVPETILADGGHPVVNRVGHAPIKTKMREVDAPFGGEASGHFYFRDNWYADSGLIGAVVGLYAAAKSGLSLRQLREKYSPYFAIPETNYEVADKPAVINQIKAEFAEVPQREIDGVSVDWPDGWINVRASNTEPLLRLNAEFETKARLDEIVATVERIIATGQ